MLNTHVAAQSAKPKFVKTFLVAAIALANQAAYAEQPIALQQTVISASGFEQNVKDAPASISVITADELKKRSYTDVTDALKNVAGVQIIGGGVEQSISIRGMSAGYTLFLIDGRPVQGNDAFALRGAQAGTPINFLPPIEAIERIEVIRGPASALYGSDAMGGVVNIITKKVGDTLRGSITAEYSTPGKGNKLNENGYQSSAFVDLPLIPNMLGLQLNGTIQHNDESHFIGKGDASASDPKYDKHSLGGKLSFTPDASNTFVVGHTQAKQEREAKAGNSLAITANDSYSESVKDNYFASHDGSYGDLQTSSYLNFDKSENKTTLNATTGNGIIYEVLTANVQGSYFFTDHVLTAGITRKEEELKDGNNGLPAQVVADPNAVAQMKRYMNSVFVEDNWRMTDDFTLTLSGRLDDSQVFGSHFSPKVYGVYNLNESFTVKGGVTSGFKAPELRHAATDYAMGSMGGAVIGNPNLKPEESISREIAFEYENFDWNLGSTLTFYVTDFKNKINRTAAQCKTGATAAECTFNGMVFPTTSNGYTSNVNVDRAQIHGIEWTVDYDILDNLTYRHSYTFTDSEQQSGEYKGKPLNDMAKHMFNASLDYQANEQLNIWAQYNYRGETSGRFVNASGSSSNGVQYPSYQFVDIGVGFKATKNLTLKAGIYNVANEEVNTDDGFNYNLDGRRYIFSLTQAF